MGVKSAKPLFPFDKLVPSSEKVKTREISDSDKDCLREALVEIKQSLAMHAKVAFFDPTGVLCRGFSDSVIESIVDNSYRIFCLTDLMENCFISSLQLAVTVLEVFNEIFDDINLDNSLYRLAVEAERVFNQLTEHVYKLDIEQVFDENNETDNC